MIPRETIDRIFEAAKVEDVVGSYISLKKRGANLLGLCPFHHEKTGSFTVSPSKGIYKCFGCGKAGNAVAEWLVEKAQSDEKQSYEVQSTTDEIAKEVEE